MEAELAKVPQNLYDLIGQLEGKPPRQTALIYQLRRENYNPATTSLSADDFWRVLEQCEWTLRTTEGLITQVSTGEEGNFELDEGTAKSRWHLQGDRSAYSPGRWVRVEYMVFGQSGPGRGLPIVTRIWIEQ
jgi:hypothetical protein